MCYNIVRKAGQIVLLPKSIRLKEPQRYMGL